MPGHARLILASQSPARRRLLKRLGFEFIVRPANLDEKSIQQKISQPARLVRELSRLKARAVSESGVVIGSDQVLVFAGRIYGKPGSSARARAQLTELSGQTVELLTGVCVREPDGREHVFTDRTRMTFRRLTRAEIRAYVKVDEPEHCAGSFKFELHGISLFESVRTSDPTAIEGLPLLKLNGVLRGLTKHA